MKMHRAVLTAAVVLVLVAAGWWMFRRGSAERVDLLALYEDLRRSKKGVGVAELRAGICQGCHQKLSAMELDRLKRTEGVKRCEYCRRILIDT